MSDLLEELHSLPSAFGHQQLLDRLGLPGDLMLFIAALGITPIDTDGALFQPAEHGPLAIVLPAYRGFPPSFARPRDEPELPNDLIAFYPSQPGRWWWRTGSAAMLGGHLIDSALMWNRPVSVVATALEYLRAQCSAVCLLDPHAARQLIGMPTVMVGNAKFGRRIDRLLRTPPAGLPKILVKEPAYDHG